jgi:hypothetical protein
MSIDEEVSIMNGRIFGVIGFLVILCVYTTLVMALSSALPFVFLGGLLVWMLWRKPMSHPGRLDADARVLAQKTGEVAEKALKALMWPLVNWP